MISAIIAILEGFVTLSVEVLIIRHSIPLVGSNAVATSIILGVVLVALSLGYYIGGIFSRRPQKTQVILLISNLIAAGYLYILIGFPLFPEILHTALSFMQNYSAAILSASALLFFIPVFLASQTIPLLNELSQSHHKTASAGKLLFYSTLGSFAGSVGTSLVLLPYLGMHAAVVINTSILFALAITIHIWKRDILTAKQNGIFTLLHAMLLCTIIASAMMGPKSIGYAKQTSETYHHYSPYHNIRVYENQDTRILSLDSNFSSSLHIASQESIFPYIKETLSKTKHIKPANILVIGAAGFSYPQSAAKYDFVKNIDVLDIDKSLQTISEEYFLQTPLNDKIHFYPKSARYFTQNTQNKYDLIFVDAYKGKMTIPPQLVSKNFFDDLKTMSKGPIIINAIFDKQMEAKFTQNFLYSLGSVFPNIYMQTADDSPQNRYQNMLISNKDLPNFTPAPIPKNATLYTDNKNRAVLDTYTLFYQK